MTPQPKKLPGRKRRVAGWTLLSLGAVVAGAWTASGWWTAQRAAHWGIATCQEGEISIRYVPPNPSFTPAGGFYEARLRSPPSPQWTFWLGWENSTTGFVPVASRGLYRSWQQSPETGTTILFWPLPVLLTAASVPFLWSGVKIARRLKRGACPACGYDKRGLTPGAVCPECGKS